MRLRSPAEFYIKYLVCHPDRYTSDAVKERLLDEGLDFISTKYIDGLRDKCKPPKPFQPTNQNHFPSYRFIIREKINRLFLPDAAMKTAKEILATPRAKEFVESMLLVNVPLTAIAGFVTRQRKIFCNVEALELYKHYFWNTDLLDSSQMRMLLQLRVDVLAEHVPEFKDKKSVLKSAYYKDPRTVAANLPYSPTSALLSQMRMGIKSSRAEIALRMMEARDVALVRAIEAVHTDGPGDDQKFMNYVNGGRILEELLQMVAKPEDQLRKQLSAIGLRTETKALPSIHSLSGGQHTVEIAPTKDQPDDDPEPVYADLEPGPGHDDGN